MKKIAFVISKIIKTKSYQNLELAFCWVVTIILIASLFNKSLASEFIYQITCSAVIVFWAGRNFIFQAIVDVIKNHRFNMSAAVFIGSQVCFFYSLYIVIQNQLDPNFPFHNYYFLEAVSIVTFIKSGDLITDALQGQIQKKLNDLKTIEITTGYLITDMQTLAYSETPINDIKPGDKLLVKSQSIIPVDGRCYSYQNIIVNESVVTGESDYIRKENYEKVIGGSLNVGNDFVLTVESDYAHSTVAQIMKRVDDIEKQKPKIQRLSDVIFNWFVPVIILLAIGTFIFQYFDGYQFNQIFHHLNWTNPHNHNLQIQWAIFTTVSVLIVACPCALGMAIPVAVAIGFAKARTIGASFANISTFERIKDIKVIAMDKTGTLTTGKMNIQGFYGPTDNLPLIYALELISSHPIARTFNNYFENFWKNHFNNIPHITKAHEIHGLGIKGSYGNKALQLLSYEKAIKMNYVVESNLAKDLQARAIHKQPLTKIAFISNNTIVNVFVVGDNIRRNSLSLVKWFNNQQVEVVMITGDNQKSADYIARQLGITHYHAEAKPEEKQKFIKKLQIKYPNKVAYVGDGFNDMMALKQSDLSIAIGEGNQNLSHESDIVLNNSDIATVAKIYKLTRFTRKLIIFNLLWAFGYNIINIPLAIIGITPPLISAILMSFSTVILVLISVGFLGIKIKIPIH